MVIFPAFIWCLIVFDSIARSYRCSRIFKIHFYFENCLLINKKSMLSNFWIQRNNFLSIFLVAIFQHPVSVTNQNPNFGFLNSVRALLIRQCEVHWTHISWINLVDTNQQIDKYKSGGFMYASSADQVPFEGLNSTVELKCFGFFGF